MGKNERIIDYLLDRIDALEKENRDVWFQKQGLSKGNEILHQEIDNLKEKIEQYEIEREHIKELITCNIVPDNYTDRYEMDLNSSENDFKTLMAILDIKPEDYRAEDVEPEKDHRQPPHCWGCKYEELEGNLEPCRSCYQGDKKEVIPDAENKD